MFEKKKIQAETLSEYLSAVRQKLNLSVKEAAGQTGIKPKFLENLEEGNFSSLPPYVYVLGFLKQLSLLYNLESQALIDQYKKEMGIHQQMVKNRSAADSRWQKYLGKLVITPKVLSLSLGVIFAAVSLVYIIWQVLSINKTPALEVFEPTDRQVIKDSFVNIKGKTDSGISLTVNDQSIFVDNQGNFKAQLGLGYGPKDLIFTAKNKFSKRAEKIISVVGENVALSAKAKDNLQLKLEFSDEVTLTFVLDDAGVASESFHQGDIKIFAASKKIMISTSDAGATRATLNGQVMGLLGRSKEKLANIPFFAESVNIK